MNLSATEYHNPPLRGIASIKIDSVYVSINDLRLANIKMIDAKYYKMLNNNKDSIINLKNNYINEQNVIIGNYKHKIIECDKLNKSINDKLKNNKKRFIITTSCLASALILILILK